TVGGRQSAVRYCEFRRSLPGGSFAVAEQATFAPDESNRWMGSAAMDGQGNIAVGYSVSSTTTYPSIRYAGRLASDPANGLYEGETTLVAGSGVQLGTAGRWGDYSALSVDPNDDCTFWHTSEYYTAASQASSSIGWLTRIGSFKFPTCGGGQAGTITGHVRDANGNTPLANALVTLSPGGYSSYTDATGLFTQSVTPGTYTATASKPNYSTQSAGVVITSGGTAVQDFTLIFTSGTLTGHVRASSTNAGLGNAVVTIDPGGLTAVTDATGLYTKILQPGTYSVTA